MPRAVGDVDASWLTEALAVQYPGTVVETSEQLEVIDGTATKVRVRNTYNRAGLEHGLPPTMIVKGGMAAHSEAMREVYVREARFYHHVAPTVPLRMPRCWFAGRDVDPSSFHCAVILEDLDARGVEFCHATRPHTYAQAARRVRDLAAMHAHMWDHPGFAPGGSLAWAEPNIGSPWFDGYVARNLDTWPEILTRPAGSLLPRMFRDAGWFREAFAVLQEEHRGHPATLCHGDTHAGNLYVEADGTPGFYDPYPVRAPWFYELPYHLVSVLDVGDRRAWDRALVGEYLVALRDHGVAEVPDFDEAWEHFRRNVAWGLFIVVINDRAFQADTVNSLYTVRFADAALSYDTYDLIRRGPPR